MFKLKLLNSTFALHLPTWPQATPLATCSCPLLSLAVVAAVVVVVDVVVAVVVVVVIFFCCC